MAQSKAHIRATTRYEAKAYDKILLRIRKDEAINRDAIASAAERAGESVNGFIKQAIAERIERLDGTKPPDQDEKPDQGAAPVIKL